MFLKGRENSILGYIEKFRFYISQIFDKMFSSFLLIRETQSIHCIFYRAQQILTNRPKNWQSYGL
jgi:hypothetical protein